MMGMTIKTLYRFECDRCGQPQEGTFDNVADARAAAKRQGYKIAEWMSGDSDAPRQTCLCEHCVFVLATEEGRRLVKRI